MRKISHVTTYLCGGEATIYPNMEKFGSFHTLNLSIEIRNWKLFIRQTKTWQKPFLYFPLNLMNLHEKNKINEKMLILTISFLLWLSIDCIKKWSDLPLGVISPKIKWKFWRKRFLTYCKILKTAQIIMEKVLCGFWNVTFLIFSVKPGAFSISNLVLTPS